MNTLIHDLRYAVRMLAKNPAFTCAAVLTLALAIGVNSAMFSLVNKTLLAPWPFADSERLVRFYRQSADGSEALSMSYPDYLDYRDRSDVFDDLVAHSFIPANVDLGQGGESRFGEIVSGNYFTTLGVKPYLGRLLSPEDNRTPGEHPVTVLSHGFWIREFGAAPDAVGKTITIGNHPFTIVGVAPEGFSGVMPVAAPNFWATIVMMGEIRPEDRFRITDRGSGMFQTFGKIKSNLSLAQARAGIAVTASQMKEIDPVRYADDSVLLKPARGIIPLTPNMEPVAVLISTLIMCMVGLVLVVGCANIANLLLARSTVRRKEIGIRMAIGAPRRRVVQQLLTESILLAVLGGGLGLVFAMWTLDLLVASLPNMPFNIVFDLDFGVDWRVLAFTGGVSLFAGIFFGLFPALGATKLDIASSLKNDSGLSFGVKRSRLRNALTVAQVSASLVLLIVAGLFGRSLLHGNSIKPGFDHENILAVMFDLGAQGFDETQNAQFCEQLLERTQALPGVESACIDYCPPLTMTMSTTECWIEGHQPPDPNDARVSVAYSTISESYFKTLGIPLLRGRDFSDQDHADAPRVAVVNQAFVDKYWPDRDPIGMRVSTSGPEGPFVEIVGVTATIKHWTIGEAPRPFLYRALSQQPNLSFGTLLLRTSGEPTALAPSVHSVMRELAPNMSPANTSRFTEQISIMLLPAKLMAAGFGLFGLLALLLAGVGLYGVMSYSVSQRTREIGIRTALGAQRSDIIRLVVKQGLVLTAVGAVIGLGISLAGTRVFSDLLYDVGAADPLTFVAVTMLMLGVAALACFIPAGRASKVDPMKALRCE